MVLSEQENLQRISEGSLYSDGIMQLAIRYCFQILQRHLTGTNLLEMGPAEGVMTELLASTGKDISIVEGSALFCEDLRRRFPQAKITNSLFETFEPKDLFDTIVMGHVLEHVSDPVFVLKRARTWLKPGGKIFAAVPNASSIHRRAAVVMGLLAREDELNELDLHHGHRRVFSRASFQDVFIQAGLQVETYGGYWLKPISNKQIENSWNRAMIEAFLELGEQHPEIAGEIYIVASGAAIG